MKSTGKKKIVIIGLGYVGLPLVQNFSKFSEFDIIGYDTDSNRVRELKDGVDSKLIIPMESAQRLSTLDNVLFTDIQAKIEKPDFIFLCISTPIDENKKPDLTSIQKALISIGDKITEDTTIVFESTLPIGGTEYLINFLGNFARVSIQKYGYSPERISPTKSSVIQNEDSDFTMIPKLVSGNTPEVASGIKDLYDTVMQADTHLCSIRVAELSKLYENVSRDVNIALANTISKICHDSNINTSDVIAAASTKPGFNTFYPGLVGGHCIPVDPYYLMGNFISKIDLPLVKTAREINEGMISFVSNSVDNYLNKGDSILILGAAYKGETTDLRNSGSVLLADTLSKKGYDITITDPYILMEDIENEKNISEIPTGIKYFVDEHEALSKKYKAIIIAVDHIEYRYITRDNLSEYLLEKGLIFNLINKTPSDWSL